jgi:hypothetical protein
MFPFNGNGPSARPVPHLIPNHAVSSLISARPAKISLEPAQPHRLHREFD